MGSHTTSAAIAQTARVRLLGSSLGPCHESWTAIFYLPDSLSRLDPAIGLPGLHNRKTAGAIRSRWPVDPIFEKFAGVTFAIMKIRDRKGRSHRGCMFLAYNVWRRGGKDNDRQTEAVPRYEWRSVSIDRASARLYGAGSCGCRACAGAGAREGCHHQDTERLFHGGPTGAEKSRPLQVRSRGEPEGSSARI